MSAFDNKAKVLPVLRQRTTGGAFSTTSAPLARRLWTWVITPDRSSRPEATGSIVSRVVEGPCTNGTDCSRRLRRCYRSGHYRRRSPGTESTVGHRVVGCRYEVGNDTDGKEIPIEEDLRLAVEQVHKVLHADEAGPTVALGD